MKNVFVLKKPFLVKYHKDSITRKESYIGQHPRSGSNLGKRFKNIDPDLIHRDRDPQNLTGWIYYVQTDELPDSHKVSFLEWLKKNNRPELENKNSNCRYLYERAYLYDYANWMVLDGTF